MREYYLVWGDSDCLHLRPFKKGFRHLWMMVCENEHWTSLEILSLSYEIETFNQPLHQTTKDILNFWADCGYTWMQVYPGRARWWVPEPLTCVTVAKKFLGLNKFFIWTPYQLYKYLREKKENVVELYYDCRLTGDEEQK